MVKSQKLQVKSRKQKMNDWIRIKLVFVFIVANWRSVDQGLPGYRFNIEEVKIGR